MSNPPSAEPEGLRERKKRRTRSAIRAAALELFVKHGYESVSVEQIAAAADVSRATFFNYFPSKEAVITEPDPEEVAAWAKIRDGIPDDEPPWPAITQAVLEGLRSSEHSFVAQKRIKAASPSLGPTFARSMQWISQDLREWVELRTSEEARGYARLQLNVAMAAVMTAYDEWQADQPFARFLAAARTYLERIAEGVGPPED
jgi:AcrR family transcriptional regulator